MLHKKPISLTFFTKFLLAVIILQTGVYFLHSSSYFSQLIQESIASCVGFFYSMVEPSIVNNSNLLIHQDSPNFLIVDNSCTGLMLIASVSSAIIAFDYAWQVKIKMVIIGVLVLQCENIIRIMHLLYIVKQDNDNFDFFHLYVWQTINFVTALIVIVSLDKFFKGSHGK
jgi:exosortase/archaeosortase family protein